MSPYDCYSYLHSFHSYYSSVQSSFPSSLSTHILTPIQSFLDYFSVATNISSPSNSSTRLSLLPQLPSLSQPVFSASIEQTTHAWKQRIDVFISHLMDEFMTVIEVCYSLYFIIPSLKMILIDN